MRVVTCLILVGWCLSSCGGESDDSLPVVPGPAHLSEPIRYALDVLGSLDELEELSDPPAEIRKREEEYTRYWLKRAVSPAALSRVASQDMRFVSGVGPRKDDAVILSSEFGGNRLLIVDTRLLILSLRGTAVSSDGVSDCFDRAVNYAYYLDKRRATFTVEASASSDGGQSWGVVPVRRGRATGWFESPIHWYMSGDQLVLVFEKVLKPAPSKIPIPMERAPDLVGGVPLEEPRAYLRFKRSNRDELSRKYYRRGREGRGKQRAAGDTAGTTKGKVILRD